MRALLSVFSQPTLQIGLEFCQAQGDLLTERKAIELLEQGLMEPRDDPMGLGTLDLGAGMVNILDRQVPRLLVGVGTATVLCPPIRQDPAQRDLVGSKEGHPLVSEQLRRGQRGLPIVELGKGYLTLGINEGLRVDPPHAL